MCTRTSSDIVSFVTYDLWCILLFASLTPAFLLLYSHISLLPTELWLQRCSGSAKYWTNARHCRVWSTVQSTELIPFYLVAGHAFNWLLCAVRTKLWDWITFRHQQPQRQCLYNDHSDSLQEHDAVAFTEGSSRAVVNNSDCFTLVQVNTLHLSISTNADVSITATHLNNNNPLRLNINFAGVLADQVELRHETFD